MLCPMELGLGRKQNLHCKVAGQDKVEKEGNLNWANVLNFSERFLDDDFYILTIKKCNTKHH